MTYDTPTLSLIHSKKEKKKKKKKKEKKNIKKITPKKNSDAQKTKIFDVEKKLRFFFSWLELAQNGALIKGHQSLFQVPRKS